MCCKRVAAGDVAKHSMRCHERQEVRWRVCNKMTALADSDAHSGW